MDEIDIKDLTKADLAERLAAAEAKLAAQEQPTEDPEGKFTSDMD